VLGVTYSGGSYVLPQGAGATGDVIGWGTGTNPNQLEWVTNGSGGAVDSVSAGTSGNLTITPTTGAVIADLSDTISVTTSVTTPTLDITGSFINPWTSHQPSVTGYVLSCTTGGALSWVANGGGGGGAVSSVTGTTNQVLVTPTTGATVVSLPTAIITPGSLEIQDSVSSEYDYILPVTDGYPGDVLTWPDTGNQTYWFPPILSLDGIFGTTNEITVTPNTSTPGSNPVVGLSSSLQIGSLTTTGDFTTSSDFQMSAAVTTSTLTLPNFTSIWPTFNPSTAGFQLTGNVDGTLFWGDGNSQAYLSPTYNDL
jgi:hypothetical protein